MIIRMLGSFAFNNSLCSGFFLYPPRLILHLLRLRCLPLLCDTTTPDKVLCGWIDARRGWGQRKRNSFFRDLRIQFHVSNLWWILDIYPPALTSTDADSFDDETVEEERCSWCCWRMKWRWNKKSSGKRGKKFRWGRRIVTPPHLIGDRLVIFPYCIQLEIRKLLKPCPGGWERRGWWINECCTTQ